MIKLKNILHEVFEEIRESGRGSGEKEFTISVDGKFIPALSSPNDNIEINVTVLYNFDPGYPSSGAFGSSNHSMEGEGASVEITGHDIFNIIMINDKNIKREINYDMLHPQQKKAIDDLVDEYINKNEENITNKILDGYDG